MPYYLAVIPLFLIEVGKKYLGPKNQNLIDRIVRVTILSSFLSNVISSSGVQEKRKHIPLAFLVVIRSPL